MTERMFDYLLRTASPSSEVRRPVPPRITPYSEKKKRYVRDSLNSRMKLGRPGSRRYRHWENEFFLVKNLTETESDISDIDESLLPGFGAFAPLFDIENKVIWEPLIDITEEQQRILLKLDEEISYFEQERVWDPEQTFEKLRFRSRKLLREHKFSQYLHDIDSIVFSFLKGQSTSCSHEFLRSPQLINKQSSKSSESLYEITDKEEYLVFAINDKFKRLVLHSLCEFYGLVSYSVDLGNERVTVVRKRMQLVDEISSLIHFLIHIDEDEDEDEDEDNGDDFDNDNNHQDIF